jgi:hypothetical protein
MLFAHATHVSVTVLLAIKVESDQADADRSVPPKCSATLLKISASEFTYVASNFLEAEPASIG